ncbi:hypothetical protein [Chamaesiphon sp. VAR_69_metabat_338]|uniref:hypothetical protein n=1 Tax=Chamaesiphon sp. VAR_69_metabat_338 TaxID=2964704 RepID=UPI00286EA6E5|nr:hypothetical protein [Chamaesiphon sp. VAR_69_metabat_338]
MKLSPSLVAISFLVMTCSCSYRTSETTDVSEAKDGSSETSNKTNIKVTDKCIGAKKAQQQVNDDAAAYLKMGGKDPQVSSVLIKAIESRQQAAKDACY